MYNERKNKEIKKPVVMLWQNGKTTKHNLTDTQKQAFKKLYQTFEVIFLKA